MKRLALLLLMLLIGLTMSSCGKKEEVLTMGLNAVIVDMETENGLLYVRDADESSVVFGESCALDCRKAAEEERILYVNYETENDVRMIELGDLEIGDAIIVSLYESEKASAGIGAAVAEQIQLATQRMN